MNILKLQSNNKSLETSSRNMTRFKRKQWMTCRNNNQRVEPNKDMACLLIHGTDASGNNQKFKNQRFGFNMETETPNFK